MSALVLDRMLLDDVGLNPRRLAEAIHTQLGDPNGAIPVYEIAGALDIEEIREHPLINFEAALVTRPERDTGKVVLNLSSSLQRRRFSLGHELYHFLNPTHIPTTDGGFQCTRVDMMTSDTQRDRHRRQEGEANRFSIELLTPRKSLKAYLSDAPGLRNVIALAREFNVSREASARRYVECHPADIAIVFCKETRIRYWAAGSGFPKFSIRPGDQCDLGMKSEGTISDPDDVPTEDWLAPETPGCQLTAQTLWQAAEISMTLLHAVTPEDDDDPGFDDTYQRFSR